MAKENDSRKRDTLSFYVTSEMRKSEATCRFIDEYRASAEHAVKRAKVTAALQAGQMMEECGLLRVMAYLDTEAFYKLDVTQRQQLLLARMQEFLGVSPQLSAVTLPQAVQKQPVATSESEPTEELLAVSPPAEDESSQAPADKQVDDETTSNPRINRFASKLSPG
ncbi:hypothetical protein [Pantoea sp. CCBC3-3-1]|uniref:hypothetical protein n=1 Tax=Pantoea sp. CCBC3-3-1 TaxID=2490851 RepID=UPI0011BD69BC|nr:hypothetical protein [Pantoea sp. CCBC3-3-1]